MPDALRQKLLALPLPDRIAQQNIESVLAARQCNNGRHDTEE
jgi:hypothetical protein